MPVANPKRRTRPIVIAAVLLGIVCAGFGTWILYDVLSPREALYHQAMTRGNAIVAALGSYKSDHFEYPKHLSALVPAYLPEIPEPFQGAQWGYNPDDNGFLLEFCDRGGFPHFWTTSNYTPGQWDADSG